jgi:hypothetical protein
MRPRTAAIAGSEVGESFGEQVGSDIAVVGGRECSEATDGLSEGYDGGFAGANVNPSPDMYLKELLGCNGGLLEGHHVGC